MTISVQVSVNGNYKCPVKFKQGEREQTEVVSGRGNEGPKVLYIPFYHSADVMTVEIGPETQDNGDAE